MIKIKYFFTGIIFLCLSGCMLYLPENNAPIEVEERNEAPVSVPEARENSEMPPAVREEVTPSPQIPTNQAVISLLDEAEQLHRQGKLVDATATLERAQRIAPRDPRIYYRLSVIRLEQGNYTQAEQLARKSIASATGNHALQASAWELIAVTRLRRNDIAGAEQARANAATAGGYSNY